MLRNLWQAIGLSLLAVFSANLNAQSSISVPSDSKFVLQVDLQALKSSKVGSSLFEMAKKAAMEEVGKNIDSKDVSTEKIKEVLGMDPFEEIQGIVICASDYEKPEKSLLGMVRLKKTTGNIEGLLLALPGYEKSEHRNYEIHAASPGEDAKVFGAIHKNAAGNKTLILGANKSSVTGLFVGRWLVSQPTLKSSDAKNAISTLPIEPKHLADSNMREQLLRSTLNATQRLASKWNQKSRDARDSFAIANPSFQVEGELVKSLGLEGIRFVGQKLPAATVRMLGMNAERDRN